MRAFAGKANWTLSDKNLAPVSKVRGQHVRHQCGRCRHAPYADARMTQLWSGNSLVCYTEAEIFAAMGLPYKAPNERDCD